MAVTATELRAVLTLQDQMSAKLTTIEGALGRLGSSAGNASGGFLKLSSAIALGNVAAAAIIGTFGKVAGAITGGISASTDFGQSMANIRSVLTTSDSAQFSGQLSELALKLGKELPLSASDAGAGIEALAKKGISAGDILAGAGRAVAVLASVTGEDLATGATVAAAAINTFGLTGQQVAGVTDLMAGAVLRGGTTVGQFGQGLQQAGTTVSLFGGTVQDVTLALGVMAKAGVQGSDAGTSLKVMYQNLIPTTQTAIAAQKALGLVTASGASAFIDAGGKVKSYEEISKILADATRDLSEAQRAQALETIFGTDAVRAAGIAVEFGTGKFGDFAAAVRSVSAEGSAKDRLNSLAGDMKNLAGSVETLQISLGQKLDPALRGLGQAANVGVGAMIDTVKGLDFSGIVDPIKAAFDAAGKFIADGGSITGAVAQLIDQLTAFAGTMFGSGFTLIATFAQGMVSGIAAIFQAASAVAEAVASFLVGSSPPPAGPLSKIDQDGRTLIETYAAGMGAANLGAVEDVAAKVQASLTDFKGLESIGAEVEGQIRLISDAMEEVSRASQDIGFQIQDIKTGYEDQLAPLKDQLAAIDDVNDSLNKQLDITDQIAGLNLKAAENAAKGDPSRRAEIAGRQESNRFAQDALQLDLRSLELSNKKDKSGKGSNDAAIASAKARMLQLDQEELGLKKDLAALSDRSALAEISKAKTALDLSGDARKIEEKKAELQRELLKIPLEQQIKDITAAQKAALSPLEAQKVLLDRQSAALERQRKDWQGLEGDIKRAAAAVKPEKAAGGGGGGGGAGGGVKLPGLPAGGAKIPNIGDLAGKAADAAQAQAMLAGEKVAKSMADGVRAFFAANGAKIIVGALGALVGGIALGPIGILLGAALGAAIGDGIQKAIPDLGKKITLIAFIFEAFGKILAGQDAYIVAFREALKKLVPPEIADGLTGIVATIGQMIQDVKTAVAGGLPGIVALLGTWAVAFVGWIAPQIPAMLTALGALIAQLGTWIAAQLPVIGQQLLTWGTAFVNWIAPQIPPMLAALGQLAAQFLAWIGTQAQPILTQLLTWGKSFVAWVAPQIPTMLAELGKLAGAAYAWISDNEPMLAKHLAAWGVEFVAWVAVAAVALTPKLIDFLATITAWILVTGVPELGKFAAKMGVAIVQGIVDGLGNFASKIGPIILNGIKQALGGIDPKIAALLGVQVGGGYVAGAVTGMEAGMPVLAAAAGDLATVVPEAFRDKWAMHSPSQVAVDQGLLYAAGLAQGIAQGDSVVAEAVLAIVKYALANNIDPLIAVALAKAESNLGRNPIGDSGHSVGLFQLHDAGQGAGMTVADRLDPWVNAKKFLDAHGPLFQKLIAEGRTGPDLASAFGRGAERPSGFDDPNGVAAGNYKAAYAAIMQLVGAQNLAVPAANALGAAQKQATDWAAVFAQQQLALTQTLEGQAPAGRNAVDAMSAFRDVLGPIERQIAGGTIGVSTLEFKLLDLARATGVATKPWERFNSGAIDSSAAMQELIDSTAALGPDFAAVAAYQHTAGSDTIEASLRWFQAAKNYNLAKTELANAPAVPPIPAVPATPAGAAAAAPATLDTGPIKAVGASWDETKAKADAAGLSVKAYQDIVNILDYKQITAQTEAWDAGTEAVNTFADAAHQIGDYLDEHEFHFKASFDEIPSDYKPGSPSPLENALRGIADAGEALSRIRIGARYSPSEPNLSIAARQSAVASSSGRSGETHYHISIEGNVLTEDQLLTRFRDGMIKHGRRNAGRVWD